MHFFYIDESGCTGQDLDNAEQPIFVMGGLSVRDEGWIKTVTEYHDKVKSCFNGKLPRNFELHAEELLAPEGSGPFVGWERQKRNNLAFEILDLCLSKRRHQTHICAIDKSKLKKVTIPSINSYYDCRFPYLLAFDYMITLIDWYVPSYLGKSARGMLIIDEKKELGREINYITYWRRYPEGKKKLVKYLVEFSYAVDSVKNPMVQVSDLICFISKKFFEIKNGYKQGYSQDAINFFNQSYSLIKKKLIRERLVARSDKDNVWHDKILKEVCII